jgi:hypothetical protein
VHCLELQYRLKCGRLSLPASDRLVSYFCLYISFPLSYLFRHILFFQTKFQFTFLFMSQRYPNVYHRPDRRPPIQRHSEPVFFFRNLEILWYTSIRISIAWSFIRGVENLILLYHNLIKTSGSTPDRKETAFTKSLLIALVLHISDHKNVAFAHFSVTLVHNTRCV